MRILIVEDCEDDRQLFSRWLMDHELVFCNSPMETYARLLTDTRFDACICDYNLPMASGDNFIVKLQASCRFPVIPCSGFSPETIETVDKEPDKILEALDAVVLKNDR